MRRFTSLLMLSAVLSTMILAGSSSQANQEVTGSILAPTPTAARGQRCAYTAAGSQGVVGWTLTPTPGKLFRVEAVGDPSVDDFDITFYATLTACAENSASTAVSHANVAGNEFGIVPADAGVAVVTLYSGNPGASFVYRESDLTLSQTPASGKHFTIVAVVDNGFSPYHFDFLGPQYPTNLDSDSANDVDFTTDPAGYISGYPGSTAINITIPTSPTQNVSGLRTGADATEWAKFNRSTTSNVSMYRFTGTKIIGAVDFSASGGFYLTNDDHGTRSAASAAGNVHGTCPECLFVLVKDGNANEGLAWAAKQPWIDVVTNSYGHSVVGGAVRDNVYLNAPVATTRQAVERGQTILFSSGNGLVNAFDVPMFTYWSSEKGPDWMITVGATDPRAQQQYSGAGKPVDISSIGVNYPSTGGTTANGTGTHSGTSNATPVVAGTFAKLIQRGRELFDDQTEGVAGGVLAQGSPYACGSANGSCALADGVLTRAEVQEVVFNNVLPSPFGVAADTVWPSTSHNYYYQGHGALAGRIYGDIRFLAEQRRIVDGLTGDAAPFARPAGEANWFVIDSKCRQRLWGAWNGGYYNGTDPVLDRTADPFAWTFNEWCSRAQQDLLSNRPL